MARELDIIATVIIGGKGTMIGTIIGTLLISFVRNGLTLLDISTNIQLVGIRAISIIPVEICLAGQFSF